MNRRADHVGAPKRVTSVDVAADAGVSQATVARVFSSPDVVAELTRERVIASADRLGYVPNAIARSLKQQRTNIIGAAVPAYGEYWQHVFTSFSRQLAQHGKQLLLFSFPDNGDVDAVLSSVQQFRLDGIVFAPTTISQARLIQLVNEDTPIVAFNQPAAADTAATVAVDNEGGMRQIAAHLIDLGVSTARYIGGTAKASTDQLRYRGATLEFNQAGVAVPYFEAGDFSYESGYKVAQQLVLDGDLPDAFVVAGDELAFGLIDGLSALDVSVPDDVMVTGFDGLPQASWAGYDLTTLVQPTELLVERAIDMLLEPGDSGRTPPRQFMQGTVRVGRTTRRQHEGGQQHG